jgi:nucleoredoxin
MAQPVDVWERFFRQGLLDRDGKEVSREFLKGKYVGIYCSAHWCRTCQKLSPKLVPFRNQSAAEFEIVFISSDHGEPEQFAYMHEYGILWPTMKHHSAPAFALKPLFNVQLIPTLIILSPNGELITTAGRFDVEEDPAGALAKWKSMPTTPVPPAVEPAPYPVPRCT